MDAFRALHWSVSSVDTKKTGLVGEFKNSGKAWCQEAVAMNTHDFLQEAVGRAVPYGVYDLCRNRGFVFVGDSADTAQFPVEAISRWWETEGRFEYPDATHLLILADAGGSNGCRPRSWKKHLQERLSDALGLTVTVCHYPSGCSKYNPIEHRLFGPISKNWAGKVLKTFEHLLSYIRGTTNRSGLEVSALRVQGEYPKGEKVTDTQMASLRMEPHAICPRWNYTFRPRRPQPIPALA